MLLLTNMGNRPSHITHSVTTSNSDQPVGCCFQFQKITSTINSKFSCCKKSTSVTVDVQGNSNQTNVEVKR